MSAHPLQTLLASVPLHCPRDVTPSGSDCLTQLEQAFYSTCQALGYAHGRFSCWTTFTDDEGQPHYWYSNNFSNFPAAWEQQYEQQQLYLIDPVVRAIHLAPETAKVVCGTWEDAIVAAQQSPLGETATEQTAYQQSIRAVYATAAGHGLRHGLYFSCQDGSRHVAISLACREGKPQPSDDTWQTLFALAQVLTQAIALTGPCERCRKSARTEGLPALQVSAAQVRVLQLFLQQPGASLREIAQELGTGVDGVNYHLKTLRQRLGKPGLSGYALAQFARELNLV